jgi:hypothetical protein
MALIVYGDFSEASCYLAARRADVLSATGVRVDWRAVEHRPGIPVTGLRPSAAEREALRARLAELEALLLPREVLPSAAALSIVPKTEAAVSAYAEAYGTAVADDVRRLLFELYWREGADIGRPTVLRAPLAGPMLRADAGADPLRQVGYAVSVDGGPITTDAWRRIRSWRSEWQQLGGLALPVVLVDGATLAGVDALRRLGKEIVFVGAEVSPDLPDPRRYPAVEGRPSMAWVSEIGGRWRTIYRSPAMS